MVGQKAPVGDLISDSAWAALIDRTAWAGVYAVKTTKIVCNFGCPSRRPSRGNVVIFATFDLAKADGFRACKRCAVVGTDLIQG